MPLEELFHREGNYTLKREAMTRIRQERDIGTYSLVERELSGPLRHNAFVTLASLDFDRTLPALREELQTVPESYSWMGYADYRTCPFICTMEVILEERDNQGKLQESINRFHPLSERERAFFAYTLHCLFYTAPEREKEIFLENSLD